VATGHLVAWLEAALDRQINLDHFLDTRRQLVALGQLLFLRLEGDIEVLTRLLNAVSKPIKLLMGVLVIQADVEPMIVF
jgi:hypothetical protein